MAASLGLVCRHPAQKRFHDRNTGEVICLDCAEVLPNGSRPPPGETIFGRGPTNSAVFNGNMGSTTIGRSSGSKPHLLHAVAQVQGTKSGERHRLQRIIRTCPCGHQNNVEVYGDHVHCELCHKDIGHYIFRFLPNGENPAVRFWADLRILQLWNPPEDNPVIRAAREVFSQKVLGKLSDEDAHRLAQKYLRGAEQIAKVTKRDLDRLLDSVIESEGVFN